MSLYLVQHGKSLSKDVDPEKGLSEEGRTDVQKIADTAKFYGVKVSKILHSGKTRAKQTARIFASALGIEDKVEETAGIKPLDDVSGFAPRLVPDSDLMVVGHLPFMEKLASYLVTGSDETTIFQFQNGGIVCLDKGPGEQAWVVKWSLSPNIG
jgi:phosphohistidine phosphatase